MLNKLISAVFLSAVACLALADTVIVNPDSPEEYTVQKGDTLWDISGRFLAEPWRWPEIWKVNPQIENPHLIYPGDVISLSFEEGSPVLTVARGVESTTAGDRRTGADRVVKLSPRVRAYDKQDAIPTIPIDAIRQFLSRPMVVTEAEIDGWPYIVSSFEQHLVAGPGNKIYVRGLADAREGELFSIFRKGNAYRRGGKYGSGELLGYEAVYVGEAVLEESGAPSTAVVTQADREILNGDRLVRHSEDDVSSNFVPRQPGNRVDGNIISVVDGLSQIGQFQIVVLDVGARDGLEVGHVLGIYQSGHVVTDKIGAENQAHPFIEYLGSRKAAGEQVHLPPEYAGVVMVFRTYPQVSFALVMQTRSPIHINDAVANL